MRAQELDFPRPDALQASAPPEARGLARDEVRLLVSRSSGHTLHRFADLPDLLEPGDLLVVNRSATLPASLSAEGRFGPFVLNLSSDYGRGLWLAEDRWSADRPGPLPLKTGSSFSLGESRAKVIGRYPGLPRLVFVQLEGDLAITLQRYGEPIRYGYLRGRYGLEHYQTVFADTPGSAEMPSAARPFTLRVLARLHEKGVGLAKLTLHTGVSSLELGEGDLETATLYPEPFDVPAEAARAVNQTRAAGGRVVAVGTTVVKALESAWDGERVQPARGFTRRFLRPGRPIRSADGLITGLHDPRASHLALLYALAGPELVRAGYAEAVQRGLLWHEFGDSHLILP